LSLQRLRLTLLHCDNVSVFRHIAAAPVGFADLALIASGDNGLNGKKRNQRAGRLRVARAVPAPPRDRDYL
jgi:hypothetical protein